MRLSIAFRGSHGEKYARVGSQIRATRDFREFLRQRYIRGEEEETIAKSSKTANAITLANKFFSLARSLARLDARTYARGNRAIIVMFLSIAAQIHRAKQQDCDSTVHSQSMCSRLHPRTFEVPSFLSSLMDFRS